MSTGPRLGSCGERSHDRRRLAWDRALKGTLGYLFLGRGTLPIVKVPAQEYLRLRGQDVTALHAPEDWETRAACRGQSAAIFLPLHTSSARRRGQRASDRPRPCAPPALCVKSASTTP